MESVVDLTDEDIDSLGSVDLRTLRARIVDAEGDLVLLVDDGDVLVEFEPGLCGSWEQAIVGAEHLAEVAQRYADTLRLRGLGRTA